MRGVSAASTSYSHRRGFPFYLVRMNAMLLHSDFGAAIRLPLVKVTRRGNEEVNSAH